MRVFGKFGDPPPPPQGVSTGSASGFARPATALPVGTCRQRLCRAAGPAARGAQSRRHPAFRSQNSFQQSGHVKVRIEAGETNSQAERLYFDFRQIIGGRILQALCICWREADLNTSRQAYYDTVSGKIVIGGFRAGAFQPLLPIVLSRLNSAGVGSVMKSPPSIQ